jgi:hypothetical protein
MPTPSPEILRKPLRSFSHEVFFAFVVIVTYALPGTNIQTLNHGLTLEQCVQSFQEALSSTNFST